MRESSIINRLIGKFKKKKAKGMSLFQSKRRKEKLKLINDYQKKIKELLRIKIYESKVINQLVRQFLSELCNIKIGFTSKEFEENVDQKCVDTDLKRRIVIYLEHLEHIRYSYIEVSDEKLQSLMQDFLMILEELKKN